MTSNVARLADMNEALTKALAPFARERLAATFGDEWPSRSRLPAQCNTDRLDGHACLYAIIHNWFDAFKNFLPHALRSAASSALDGRNAAAHPFPPPDDFFTLRALIGAAEILICIDAPQELAIVVRHRDELIRQLARPEPDPPSRSATPRPGGSPSPTPPPPSRPPTNSGGAALPSPGQPNASSTAKGNLGAFWVYENWTHKFAKVHAAPCSYCNNGQGMHAQKSNRNGQWLGAYDTRAAAFEAAAATGQPDIRACKNCDS